LKNFVHIARLGPLAFALAGQAFAATFADVDVPRHRFRKM